MAPNQDGEPGDQHIDYPPFESGWFGPSMIAGPVGDVNGDGLEDLATGIQPTVFVTFSSRQGEAGEALDLGGFQVRDAYYVIGLSTAGDVNGDGRDELAIRTPGRVEVLFGKDTSDDIPSCCSVTNGFTVTGTGRSSSSSSNYVVQNLRVITLDDLNGDAVDDLLVDVDGGAAIVYPPRVAAGLTIDASRPGPFVSRIVSSGDRAMRETFVDSLGDLDGDGREDLLVAGEEQTRSDQVAYGMSAPSPNTTLDVATALAQDKAFELRTHDGTLDRSRELEKVITLGDQNGDGRREVAMLGRYDGNWKLRVAHSPPFGTELDIHDLGAPAACGYRYRPCDDVIDVGDQNGDGRDDFATSRHVYFSNPTKETEESQALQSGFHFDASGRRGIVGTLRDLNGDGREELAVAKVKPMHNEGGGDSVTYALDVFDSAVAPEVPRPDFPEVPPRGGELEVPIAFFTGAGSRGGTSLLVDPRLELARREGPATVATDPAPVPSGGAHAELRYRVPSWLNVNGEGLIPGVTYRARYTIANGRGQRDTGPWRSFLYRTSPGVTLPPPDAPSAAPGTPGTPDTPFTPPDRVPGITGAGTAAGEQLLGSARRDLLTGRGGADFLDGKGGSDWLDGGPGADRIFGRGGGDTLIGRRGRDRLYGGRDGDAVSAGPGNDFVDARDGVKDFVACGPGRDAVRSDPADTLRGCEERAARP